MIDLAIDDPKSCYLCKLPFELLEEIAAYTDYNSYHNLRASCSSLNRLHPCKEYGFEEYLALLQRKGLEVFKFGDIVGDYIDYDSEHNSNFQQYWVDAPVQIQNSNRLDFQKRVRLELSSLTQDQYYYLCGNYLAQEALRIVDLTLKKPEDFKQIDLTVGTLNTDGMIFPVGLPIAANELTILRRLLKSHLPILEVAITRSFIYACQCGNVDIAQMILSDFNVNPSAHRSAAIGYAAQSGQLEVVRFLLTVPRIDLSYAIGNASANGHMEVVRLLLKDFRIDPSVFYNEAVTGAVNFGHFEIVKLLMSDSRVDPSDDDNAAIKWAVDNGDFKMVRLLLTDPRVDPSNANNYSILYASANGFLEIVRLLMTDSRTDPSAEYSVAIIDASRHGYLEIVRLLLTDPRVDPSADFNHAMWYASSNGHLEIVELLLTDPRVDPAGDNYPALIGAAENGHSDIVRLLISDSRVDPTDLYNSALLGAASTSNGHFGIESDPRAEDTYESDSYNDMMLYAASNGHLDIVKFLLASFPSAYSIHVLKAACDNGHDEVVKFLLKDPRSRAQHLQTVQSTS